MPTFTCPDCNAQVSTTAMSCPSCGRPTGVMVPAIPGGLTGGRTAARPPPLPLPREPVAGRWLAGLFALLLGLLGGAAGAFTACWHWRYPSRLAGADFALPLDQFAKAVAAEPFWDGYRFGALGVDHRTNLLLAVIGGGLFGMLIGSMFVTRPRPRSHMVAVPGPGGMPIAVSMALPTSGLAVACLVFGILSLVFFCALPVSATSVVLALVFGTAAGTNIRRGAAVGGGIATTGILLACVALTLDVVLIAIFGGLAAFNLHELLNGGRH